MHSQLHPHLAKARTAERAQWRPARGASPPGRLRGATAQALAATARRLDAERARRVMTY